MVDGLDAGNLIRMDMMQVEGMVLDRGIGKLTLNSHLRFTTPFTRSTKAIDTKRAVACHYEITLKRLHDLTPHPLQIHARNGA